MENKLLDSKKSEFEIFDAALASILFIIYNFVFLLIYASLPVNLTNNKVVELVASFLLESLFALVALTVAKARKVKFLEGTGLNKKFSGRMIWLCFLVSIVCLFLFSQLTGVFLEFLSLCGYESLLGDIKIASFWEYLAYVVVMCVTPALCEEILFRGAILSGLKKYGMYLAVVISSLIFTFMHGNPEQTVHQFIIGFVIGFIFVKTGNVWIGVIIHFFNNFISVTQSYLLSFVKLEEVTETVTETTVNPWISLLVSAVIAVVLAYVGYCFIRNLNKKIFEEDAIVNGYAPKLEETNATISVDGQTVETTVMVDGSEVAEETTSEEISEAQPAQEKKPLSLMTIILFSLVGIYLAYDWVRFLLIGLGVG